MQRDREVLYAEIEPFVDDFHKVSPSSSEIGTWHLYTFFAILKTEHGSAQRKPCSIMARLSFLLPCKTRKTAWSGRRVGFGTGALA
jgi:hypothetical protein